MLFVENLLYRSRVWLMEGHQSNRESLDLQQRIFAEMYIFFFGQTTEHSDSTWPYVGKTYGWSQLLHVYLLSCSGFKHAAVLSKLYVSTFYWGGTSESWLFQNCHIGFWFYSVVQICL